MNLNNQRRYKPKNPALPACPLGYLCKPLRENKCHLFHTEQHRFYLRTLKGLFKLCLRDSQPKLILGTLQKLEDQRYKLTPLNQEITSQFPGLSFILTNSQGKTLSEDHYYEARYEDEQTENGEFLVSLLEGDPHWGKIGKTSDDIEALYYGKDPIYQDEDQFAGGDFKVGIIKEKYNGQVVLKCSSSQTKYIFTTEKHQNRAFVGSTVRFLAEHFENKRRQPRGLQAAQVVSIIKCPLSKDFLYGILEVDPDPNRQIEMQCLYCPLPENINWDLLDEILYGPAQAISFTEPLISLQDFQQKCSNSFRIDSQDSRLLYLQQIIFNNEQSQEGSKVQNLLNSLCQLLSQRRKIKNMQTCYFKPFDKNLPIFQCMYIQDELKKNPEIWRSYIIASYITWPCSSKYPWVVIESPGGVIGDPQADIRVILERHKVQTDKFSKKVQKNEQEIIKSWDNEMKKNLKSIESAEEKVFTIDGESTRYRDDGFSVRKLADGEYYEVGIHIADVTRTVKERSEIYKEAEYRFHSCYIGKNFYKPMLPYSLQRYLSLQKDQWRYAFSMYILMDKEGVINLEGVKFKHALIKPIANLTYKQVDHMLSQEDSRTDDELKEAIKIMRELGEKLSERRKRLGCKLDISEEDEENFEKNSPAQMMVEEFMLLANEMATDYIKNQGGDLEKRLAKIKNEEKNMVREENQKKEEEKKKKSEEKKRLKEERKIAKEEAKRKRKEENKEKDEEKRKLKEEKKALKALKANAKKEKAQKKVKVKKILEKKIKKEILLEDGTLKEIEEHIKEEIEEEIEEGVESEYEEDEDEIERESSEEDEPPKILEDRESEISETSEKEDISEDEEDVEVKRRGSVEEEEEDVDSSLLNISKIEEYDAIAACAFLEQVWRDIDKGKRLDLGDQRKFSESVKSMMDDQTIKNSIKKYLRYLLRLNDRKVRLFINKKLRANNQQQKKEEHQNVATSNNKPQVSEEQVQKSEPKHEVIIQSKLKDKEESVNSAVVQQRNPEKKKQRGAPQEIQEKKLSKRKQAKLEKRLQKQNHPSSLPLEETIKHADILVSQENNVEEFKQKDESYHQKGVVMPEQKIDEVNLNIQDNKVEDGSEKEKRVLERKQARKERQRQRKLQKDSLLLAEPKIEPANAIANLSPKKNQAKEFNQVDCENKTIMATESRIESHQEEEKLEFPKKAVTEITEQRHSQQSKRQQKKVKQERRDISKPVGQDIVKPSPSAQQKEKDESQNNEQRLEVETEKESQVNRLSQEQQQMKPSKARMQFLLRKEKREKKKFSEQINAANPQQKEEESQIEANIDEAKTEENQLNKEKSKEKKPKKKTQNVSLKSVNQEEVIKDEANLPPEKMATDDPTNIVAKEKEPLGLEKQVKIEKSKKSRRERKAQREVKNLAESLQTNTSEVGQTNENICQSNMERDLINNSKEGESNKQQEKQKPRKSKRDKKPKNNEEIPVEVSKQTKKERKRAKGLQRGMNFDNEITEVNKDLEKKEDERNILNENLNEYTEERVLLQLEGEKLEGKIQEEVFKDDLQNQDETIQKQEKLLEADKEGCCKVENRTQIEEIKKKLEISLARDEPQNVSSEEQKEGNEQDETSKENPVPNEERLEMTNNQAENQGDEIKDEDSHDRRKEEPQGTEEEPQDPQKTELDPSSEPLKEITSVIKWKREEIEFDVQYSEDIIKKYNKLKDSSKMKFTSPIRRFHDILVHELIDKILDLEEKLLKMDNEIQKRLDKQESQNEKARKKKSKKDKKIKTRYQIFQEIYSTMKDKIKQLEKSQEKIKLYYQENHDVKDGGMDRAEREKEIMEKCKLIIADQKSIITDAIVVNLREKARVFLLDFGLECALGGDCKVIPGHHAMIKVERKRTATVGLYDDIIVRIDVKRNFPLNFEAVYVCGNSKN